MLRHRSIYNNSYITYIMIITTQLLYFDMRIESITKLMKCHKYITYII